jgi:molybdopterin/thiamine biosynthesis adenylyltransferase
LRKSTVAVLGCGSVGGPVAVALAQAGIGRLILADKDSLKASNIGRHPLGMPALNQAKVRALAARIQTDLPHVAVDAQVTWAETLLSARDAGLAQADLIVSAMGSWASESMLDEWHEATGRPVPIIYGWTEAHACAGHAVAITASGARYRDGLDETGLPALRVTEWPNGPTVRQEPACGAVFQPYGPVELGYVTNMVVELALDCLLGAITASTHRIWAARRSLLERSGGHWTPEWMSISPNGEDGGVMTERPWATPTAARVLAA